MILDLEKRLIIAFRQQTVKVLNRLHGCLCKNRFSHDMTQVL